MTNFAGKLFSYFAGPIAYRIITQQLKKKAVIVYLKLLLIMRQSLLATVLVILALQALMLGFVGTLTTAIWLYPSEELQTKLYCLLGVFMVMFLVPLVGLIFFFSERTWLRISGAKEMISTI